MNGLVDMLIKDKSLPVLFTFEDFKKRGYGKDMFKKQLSEGVEKKYIDRVYGEIYTLDVKYREKAVPKRVLSQMIVPNSYVSMYYVLRDYDWIPEMIFTVTSVTVKEDFIVDTDRYGSFMYTPLYKIMPTAGIYEEKDFQGMYRVAKPLRALCDLLYRKNKNWPWSLLNLYENFRIFPDSLEEDLTGDDFDELQGAFGVKTIEDFLQKTRKELAL